MNEQELREQIALDIRKFAEQANQAVLDSCALINEPSIEADLLTNASYVNQAFETAIMIVLQQHEGNATDEVEL